MEMIFSIWFMIVGVGLLFTYFKMRKDEVDFQKNALRTEGCVGNRSLNSSGSMDEVYVEFSDKDNKIQKHLSQPFYPLNGFIEPGTKVKIMYREKEMLGVLTHELRIVDEKYVKRTKINYVQVILSIAVLFLSVAAVLLAFWLIK